MDPSYLHSKKLNLEGSHDKKFLNLLCDNSNIFLFDKLIDLQSL